MTSMLKIATFAILGGVANASGGKDVQERLGVLESFMDSMREHVSEVSNESGVGLEFLTEVQFKKDLLVSGDVNFEGFPSDVLTVIQGILGRLESLENAEDTDKKDDAIKAATEKYTGTESAFGGGRYLKADKDKKDKKDKTKKNQEEYYGCVCADRTGMNVFLNGYYKGRQDLFTYTTEFFIRSVEPTNIEDVPPCECVDDVERVELLEAGRGFDTFEQQDQYYYPECIFECPLYGMYFPAIYGGVCYCPLVL